MPLRLDIKKKLSSRSDRVKSVDLHPTEPWVLSALYNGAVMIWNYDTQTLVKSFEVTGLPVRNARFIARKQWVITSSDDLQIRVFNYNTMDKVTSFEGHTDYIRYLEVHPTLPYVLSCADDMQIKLWDWDKNWQCTQVFEGHGHYVMMVKFNPKDMNTFASAALDRTIKIWGLGSGAPHFSLEGHERGVNCIDYYSGGDKPYLVSGSDDRTVKIWDYQTKSVIQTLDGHTHNLTAVLYHPRLPLVISACEDGTVRMWHSTTYRAETTLNYGMERAWSLAALKGSNKLAVGYDEGTVVLRLGHDMPVVSMDPTGKIVWAINNDIQTGSVKGIAAEMSLQDGEKIPLASKDLGSCEVYPQSIKHNSNGRFIVVCGDGEYIIYTSQQLRNKSFGPGLDFAWSAVGTGDFVVRESISRIKLFKNFKEVKAEKPRVCTAEGLFPGTCIGIRGSDCIAMYDWEELRLIRKIDVTTKSVYWSDNGDLVVLACDSCYYVLRYHSEVVAEAFAKNQYSIDEGVDGSFELLHEISEKVGSGQWVGDCFLYANNSGRLNYYVGGEVMTLAHLDHKMYMLGYIARENRVFLMDKLRNVYSYVINVVMLEYQTAVVRGDFETANGILPRIPADQIDNVARFLESQGFKEEALQLSTDPDQKFDLAVQLSKLDIARKIMVDEIGHSDTTDAQHKWKQLGDLALNDCNLELAEDCAIRSDDCSGLLLLYSCTGNVEGMSRLAEMSRKCGRNNVTFLALLLLGRLEDCIELLIETERLPEAAFFARTYVPSAMSRIVGLWRQDLAKVSKRAAKTLADPAEYSDLFVDLPIALKAEEMMKSFRDSNPEPASIYSEAFARLQVNVIESLKTTGNIGFETKTASSFGVKQPAQHVNPSEDHAQVQAEAQRKAAEQQARAHDEAQRKAAEEQARAHAEAQRKAAEEQARAHAEAQRKAAEDQARAQAEAQRKAAEEQARAHAEAQRKAAEEQARAHAEAQRKAAEEQAHAEAQRKAAEEQARAQAEAQRVAEEQARAVAEAQRRAAEEQARAQAEAQRKAAEEHARLQALEAQRKAAEEQARLQAAEAQRRAAEEFAIAQAEEEKKRAAAGAVAFPPPAPASTNVSQPGELDFELDQEDVDFGDDDADWGDM